MRIARKHLGWYTEALAGGAAFRRAMCASADRRTTQLAAVHDYFDRLAAISDRLSTGTADA